MIDRVVVIDNVRLQVRPLTNPGPQRFLVWDVQHAHQWYVQRDHGDPTGWKCACTKPNCRHRRAVAHVVGGDPHETAGRVPRQGRNP